MKKTLFTSTVLLLILAVHSCGTGPELRERTESNVDVNVEASSTDIRIDQVFTVTFDVSMNASTVNTNTYFIVPTAANASTTVAMAIKANIDTTICNPENAVAGTVAQTSTGSCDTGFTFTPDAELESLTDYTLCLFADIQTCNPDVDGFFDGAMIQFTTAGYSVGGPIEGLSGTVVLQNNAGDDLTITENGDFAFATRLNDGEEYAVTVLTQPDIQTCTVSNGTGTIDEANVTDVSVVCVTNYSIGGTISSLIDSVVLQNNAGDDLTITENGDFAFATRLDEGEEYAVTVSTQPEIQVCTVNNGTGTISGANITDVRVVCVTNTYSIGGTVSGLGGTVVLQNNAADDNTITSNGDFTFSTEIDDRSEYVVTVKTQPSQQLCTVSNGTGTLDGANITNVSVACVDLIVMFSSVVTGGDIPGVGPARAKATDWCLDSVGTITCAHNSSEAFISISAADEIRDMPTTYTVPTDQPIGSEAGNIIANDWADLLDGSIDMSLEAADIVDGYYWTASTSAGVFDATNNCTGFTSSGAGVNGTYGDNTSATGTWLDADTDTCNNEIKILCICW